MPSAYVLPSQWGVCKLSRFELIHIVSMIMLRSKQQRTGGVSPMEARDIILRGESPLYIRRNYTDGSTADFRIVEGGILEPLSRGN